jgi:hypothetical protein
VARDADHVEIALLTCSGGEEMARISSNDPALRNHVISDH